MQSEWIRSYLVESADLLRLMADHSAEIESVANVIADAFRNGGKVLLCGNGGSAADCQHVAAELMSRLSKNIDRPALPAIALTTDTSFLTAFSNDCGYDDVFARQVEGLGRRGDVLIALSTSGRSPNVLRAVEIARSRQVITIAIVGDTDGPLRNAVDHVIVIPSRDTQHIQEAGLAVEHAICQLVERALYPEAGS